MCVRVGKKEGEIIKMSVSSWAQVSLGNNGLYVRVGSTLGLCKIAKSVTGT